MRKLLLAAAAVTAIGIATPASAQVYFGADPYGAGAQVGPLRFGVGPRYEHRYRERYWRDREYGYRRHWDHPRERVYVRRYRDWD
jgi:hypothetical protein